MKLQPDPSLIQPREHPPIHDRAPDDLAAGTPQWLRDDLVELIGEPRVLSLIRFASDTSPYRMVPKVVVLPPDEEDVRKIFAYASEERRNPSSLLGQIEWQVFLSLYPNGAAPFPPLPTHVAQAYRQVGQDRVVGNPNSQHGLRLQVTFGVQNGCRAERNHLDGARIGGVRLNGLG